VKISKQALSLFFIIFDFVLALISGRKDTQKPHPLAGIYIHIPFCRRKCRYCDFHSTVSEALKAPMAEALHRELAARREEVAEPVRTLYFGGGTPTVYPPETLQGLIEAVKTGYDTDFEEITVEANPDDLSGDYLARLRDTDADRLSIGIQSFDDDHLQLFHRRHTGRQAIEAVRQARKHGFENIAIDLIYGIPGLSDAGWEENLRRAIDLEPKHLSAYHLTIEPRTVFGRWAERGKLAAVSDEESLRQYEILERVTAQAGYVHYEVSNFALPGYEARHNSRYWDGTPYLGIGPAAHSFDGRVRRWNTADNRAYLEHPAPGDCFESETPTDTERFNETLMTGLRTARGVAWQALEQAFGGEKIAALRTAARRYLDSGLLVDEGGRLRIPTARFLLSDRIIGDLFLSEIPFYSK
jgi:oxygen-independent coproporphyrinogen-3 oxidase